MGNMRFFTFWLLIFTYLAGTISAREDVAKDLPQCAKHCVGLDLPSSGCEETDIQCLCTSVVFNRNTTICVQSSCTIKEIFASQDYHEKACGIPERNNSEITRRVTWTLFTLALISVIGRFVYRNPKMNGSGYGLDDWTIFLVMLLLIPQQSILSTMLDLGLGKDIWNITPHRITTILYYFWISEYFYNFVMCLEKISILLLYLRIWSAISIDSIRFRYICFALLGVLVTTLSVMTIVITFQCNPISYAWHRWDGEHKGSCINTSAMIYAGAGLNISYDLVVYCLPIPKLLQTLMSKRKKAGIIFVFLCSLFATVCSIVRLQSLVKFGNTANPTWYYNAPALWSAIECHVTAVCACMPALAGVINRAWKKTFGSYISRMRSGPSNSGGGGGNSGGQVISLPRVRTQRSLFEDEDDGMELSRLRSTAASIGETRVDSVHVLTKSEEAGKGSGGDGNGAQHVERGEAERSWLELEDGNGGGK